MTTSLTPNGRSASLRLLALFMALVMVAVALPLAEARAAFVPTDDARGRLSALLAREDVQAELRRLGVDPAEAAARVEALSDAEVAGLQGLSAQPAGQSYGALLILGIFVGFPVGAALGTVAGLLLLLGFGEWTPGK